MRVKHELPPPRVRDRGAVVVAFLAGFTVATWGLLLVVVR